MTTRKAAPDSESIGPKPGEGTRWIIHTKAGVFHETSGASAFEACAGIGMNLGMVESIEPVRKP